MPSLLPDNRIRSLFGVRHPIVQGGMSWVSRHPLAAAVSEAGALGVIGSGGMDVDELRDEIRALRALTPAPFGVNVTLVNVRPDGADLVEELMRVVIDERVPIAIVGAGSPSRYTDRLHEAGTVVVHVVPSVALAAKAAAAGVDAVVAESVEAGGHVRAEGLSTVSLVPQVVDAVEVPVIAAGGIADGRGVAAAFALGTEAVQIGTRFIAAAECNAHTAYKAAVVDADAEGTALYGRTPRLSRGLRTPVIERLIEMDREGRSDEELRSHRGTGRARLGCIDGDLGEGILPAGAAAGLVHEVAPAAAIVRELVDDAARVLESLR